MRIFAGCLAALAAAAPVFSGDVPAAPSVTAEPGIKSIRLGWQPVTGASRYEVWYRPTASAAYRKFGSDLPGSRTTADLSIPAHLFDWQNARFRVAACNSAGCTHSAPFAVSELRLDASGYFKADQADWYMKFGESVDLSPRGTSFVASVPSDGIEPASPVPEAYLFARRSIGDWYRRARFTPVPNAPQGSGTGMRVAISADGNKVLIGLPNLARGSSTGEAFVYTASGSRWVPTRLAATGSEFGRWVSLGADGKVLAVGGAAGVSIYRLNGGTWTRVRHVTAAAGSVETCPEGLLTRDGSTLVESCHAGTSMGAATALYLRVHSGSNWSQRANLDLGLGQGGLPTDRPRRFLFAVGADASAQTIAAQGFRDGGTNVQVFRLTAGLYEREATLLNPAFTPSYDDFGRSVAVSGDGRALAVGNAAGRSDGTGVQRPPLTGEFDAGHVFVYQRGASTWTLKSAVKHVINFSFDGDDVSRFGWDVKLCATGATLLVGHPGEASSASGIEGFWRGAGFEDTGAAWLY
jgi:hypothetical protein